MEKVIADIESSVSPSTHSECPLAMAQHLSSRSHSFVSPLELVNHNSRSLSPSKSPEYSVSHPNSDWTPPSGFASQHGGPKMMATTLLPFNANESPLMRRNMGRRKGSQATISSTVPADDSHRRL